jgi:hypothetical protein
MGNVGQDRPRQPRLQHAPADMAGDGVAGDLIVRSPLSPAAASQNPTSESARDTTPTPGNARITKTIQSGRQCGSVDQTIILRGVTDVGGREVRRRQDQEEDADLKAGEKEDGARISQMALRFPDDGGQI